MKNQPPFSLSNKFCRLIIFCLSACIIIFLVSLWLATFNFHWSIKIILFIIYFVSIIFPLIILFIIFSIVFSVPDIFIKISRYLLLRIFTPLILFFHFKETPNRAILIRDILSINNRLAKGLFNKKNLLTLLILLPHCLQNSECPHRVTGSINYCHRCGKCDLGKLCELGEKYSLNLTVVTGGRLARRVVKEYQAQAILAVACEEDIISGICDTYPLPVYGIINQRPFGPCRDTKVSLEEVEKILHLMLETERRK